MAYDAFQQGNTLLRIFSIIFFIFSYNNSMYTPQRILIRAIHRESISITMFLSPPEGTTIELVRECRGVFGQKCNLMIFTQIRKAVLMWGRHRHRPCYVCIETSGITLNLQNKRSRHSVWKDTRSSSRRRGGRARQINETTLPARVSFIRPGARQRCPSGRVTHPLF